MRAIYLDSSAIVKLIYPEAETAALLQFVGAAAQSVASRLAAAEVRRVGLRRPGYESRLDDVLAAILLIDVRADTLHLAGGLQPAALRTLDAIHLATALEVRDEIDALVTYDRRMAEAARVLGLAVASPGPPADTV